MSRSIKIVLFALPFLMCSCSWVIGHAVYLYGYSNVTGFQVYDTEKNEVVAETNVSDVKARRKARGLYRKLCLSETDGIFEQTLVCPHWDYVLTNVSQLIVLVTKNYSSEGILPRGAYEIKRDKERVYIFVDERYDKVDDITRYFTDEQMKRILPRIQPMKKGSMSN